MEGSKSPSFNSPFKIMSFYLLDICSYIGSFEEFDMIIFITYPPYLITVYYVYTVYIVIYTVYTSIFICQ